MGDRDGHILLTIGAGGETYWEWLGGAVAEVGLEVWKLNTELGVPSAGDRVEFGPWLCEVVGCVEQRSGSGKRIELSILLQQVNHDEVSEGEE